MKTTIAILIAVILNFTSIIAQYSEENDGLHSRYRPGVGWFYSGLTPFEEGKLRKYDRLMIDLVYNDWHGDEKLFSSPWNSIGFNTSFMFDVVLSKANTVSLGVGIAYSHYNNKTKVQFLRNFDENHTVIGDFPTDNEPFRSKFGANYIEIPLELRFRTKGYQHFKFMIGGKIGYRLNSLTKEVHKINGKRYTTKNYNFPDANPLRYGATVRIGMRNWAIYGAYYFSPLFTHKESVELYPFSMGITLSLF